MAPGKDENRWRGLIEDCFRREAGFQIPMPDSEQDLIETGVLDSMGWVSFLRSLESASGLNELGAQLTAETPSFESILHALRESKAETQSPGAGASHPQLVETRIPVLIASSSVALGSRRIPSVEIDRAFGMTEGKLQHRAGIESLTYASENENELSLGTRAARKALHAAACGVQELDWIIATSETHLSYPSLAAQLHSQLLTRETCGALDVGGACLGLLNGLAVAQSLIASSRARTILVVTADVHSRVFIPGRVAGELGGLFGDGASAFLLRTSGGNASQNAYSLGEFFFGCAGQYAGAIRVAQAANGDLDTHFDGEALSRAAITRLEKVIRETELRSGIALSSVNGVATHQPNPRLLKLLANQLGLPLKRFPKVAETSGNLGSSTCGVALHSVLQTAQDAPAGDCGPIFLASLGPGLLFGGGWLTPCHHLPRYEGRDL
ncbi:MAG TPA: 3-oxoacyl-[acyl-carrier-protein] synthase III C-terminal domain-containing protein [Candidatus Solibacter sp.]|nr:3-oxoacyl-[acyl-carrier-protein] synthase III C-terminal domain-containing protein [Candidatus Solibacter sp.]